jgi:hypothetical protein
MAPRLLTATFCLLAFSAGAIHAQTGDWYADVVADSYRLDTNPSYPYSYACYNDPTATLGQPTTWMQSSGATGDTGPCAASLVCGAWGLGTSGQKLVARLMPKNSNYSEGYVAVKFNNPIYHDPLNWYGKDFIVFGNGVFISGSGVYSNSDMVQMTLSNPGSSGTFKPSTVSVSQDGSTWYTFTSGPYADDYAPTQAFAWDWIENQWLLNSSGQVVQLDFTRPVDPSCARSSFNGLNAAQGIDLYKGSGGGSSFDISTLPLPIDPISGMKWIQYIKVDGSAYGVVDAFSRVSHSVSPCSLSTAKSLPDGTAVILYETSVSAETYATGRSCYVEAEDSSAGIRVMGRILPRGTRVNLCGVMDTLNGERVFDCTSVQTPGGTFTINPKSVTNGQVSSSNLGLLVMTTGKVTSVNSSGNSFVLDDESGHPVTCVGPHLIPSPFNSDPTDPTWGVSAVGSSFAFPAANSSISVTGVVSADTSSNIRLKMRSASDLGAVNLVSGTITLTYYQPPVTGITGAVELQNSSGTILETHNITLNSSGGYSFATTLTGSFTAVAKCWHWLAKAMPVSISSGAGTVNFTLLNGDINGDNFVEDQDYSLMGVAWYSITGDANYNINADLNGDGAVEDQDYSIMGINWYQSGDNF